MTFLPGGFGVPAVLENGWFRLCPIAIDDGVKDHDAVTTSRGEVPV